MQIEKFMTLMAELFLSKGKELPSNIAAVWFKRLKDYSDSVMVHAFEYEIVSEQRFPILNDLLAACEHFSSEAKKKTEHWDQLDIIRKRGTMTYFEMECAKYGNPGLRPAAVEAWKQLTHGESEPDSTKFFALVNEIESRQRITQ